MGMFYCKIVQFSPYLTVLSSIKSLFHEIHLILRLRMIIYGNGIKFAGKAKFGERKSRGDNRC